MLRDMNGIALETNASRLYNSGLDAGKLIGEANGIKIGEANGIKIGSEMGVKAIFELCKDLQCPVNDAIERIMSTFGIDREEAEAYAKKYW